MQISNRDFVLAWVEAYNKSGGTAAVSEKLGIDATSVTARATYLRKKRVDLPHMRRARRDFTSVESLNQLIASKIS